MIFDDVINNDNKTNIIYSLSSLLTTDNIHHSINDGFNVIPQIIYVIIITQSNILDTNFFEKVISAITDDLM